MDRIRIVIADDHSVVREGVRALLERDEGLEVVGLARDGAEALDLCRELQPDVAVLDISMPGSSGLDTTRVLKQSSPCAVLILSMHEEPEYVVQAVRAGADGYMPKDADPVELRRAVRLVASGSSFFPPAAVDRLQQGVRLEEARDRVSERLEGLTSREREVLVSVARGRTNRQIAREMGISPRTVETHRGRVMDKTGIRTVAGLTRLVMEAGLDRERDAEGGAPDEGGGT